MKPKNIKKLVLDMVSFNTPQAIAINIAIIFLLLVILPTSALQNSPVPCVFKNYILPFVFRGHCPSSGIFANCECPGCGMTRALSRFLHGDLMGALAYNKLVLVLFSVMIVLLVWNILKSIGYYKKTQKIYPF